MRILVLLVLCVLVAPAAALPPPCNGGTVFEDRNGNGWQDGGEPGLPGVKVSDGVELVTSDQRGAYQLPVVDGRSSFVIKPAGYGVPTRGNGLPDYWSNVQSVAGPGIEVRRPGRRVSALQEPCVDARPGDRRGVPAGLDVLLFADPQTKSMDRRGLLRARHRPVRARRQCQLLRCRRSGPEPGRHRQRRPVAVSGIERGRPRKLGVPWLHVAGNHDLDFDALRDEDSLLTFRNTYGPDTFAWEEPEATFIVLDDVIYRPGQTPAYVGGLRDDQFAFLERYLPTLPKERLLVIGVHIPFFDAAPGRETFRHADRARLFALLEDFPQVLLLSGHSHTQRHVFHDAASGWHGAQAAARVQRRRGLRRVLVGGEGCRRHPGCHHERRHAQWLRTAEGQGRWRVRT